MAFSYMVEGFWNGRPGVGFLLLDRMEGFAVRLDPLFALSAVCS